MPQNNNRMPFKAVNNKKSPMNLNEIDINILMQNPAHIRKLIGRDIDTNKDNVLPSMEAQAQLGKRGDDTKDYLNFLREGGASLVKKYMDQNKNKGPGKNKEAAKDAKWPAFDRDKFLNDVKDSTDRSSFLHTFEEMKKMRRR